jgi:hypothetical protein
MASALYGCAGTCNKYYYYYCYTHTHAHTHTHTRARTHTTLTDTSKEVGLEVNAEKAKYVLMSLSLECREKHGMKITYRSFEIYDTVQVFRNDSSKSKFD